MQIGKYILVFLIFLASIAANANQSELENLERSLFENLNDKQQEILRAELEQYNKQLENLSLEEKNSKLKDLLLKIRDGFKVYSIARDNPQLQDSIKALEQVTGLKFYTYSYIQNNFLNYIFKRISEAWYDVVRPKGYVKLRFIFTQKPTGESPSYTPDFIVEVDPEVLQKIKVNAATFASLQASANKVLVEKKEAYAFDDLSDAQDATYNAAAKLWPMFRNFSCKGCYPNTSLKLYAVNADEASKIDEKLEIPYKSLSLKIKFSKAFTVSIGSNEGMEDFFAELIKHPDLKKFFTTTPDIQKLSKTYFWTINKSYQSTVTYLWTLKYQFIRNFIKAAKGDLEGFDEWVVSQYPLPVKEYLLIQQNDAVTLSEGNKPFDFGLDELLRIAEIRKLLGEEKWKAFSPSNHNPIIARSEEQYIKYFNDLLKFYQKKEDLLTQIDNCLKPGRDNGQMTYLANQLQEKELAALTVKQRIHILNIMSLGAMRGSYTERKEETIAWQLIEQAPAAQVKDIFTSLVKPSISSIDDRPLINILIEKLDDAVFIVGGNNYNGFMAALAKALFKSLETENTLNNLSLTDFANHVIFWDEKYRFPPIGNNTYSVTLESNGDISYFRKRVKNYFYPPSRGNNDPLPIPQYDNFEKVSLKPFDPIIIFNRSKLGMLEEAGASHSELSIVPAIFLKYASDKEFNSSALKAAGVAGDVLILATGPGLISKAGTVMRAFIIMEMAGAVANLTINVTDLGNTKYSTIVDQYNLVMAAIGITQLGLTTLPKALNAAQSITSGIGKQTALKYLSAVASYETELAALSTKGNKAADAVLKLKNKIVGEWKVKYSNENVYSLIADEISISKGATNIIETATHEITKKRLPESFVSALKKFGKSEEDILDYFTNYHNVRSSKKFFNEIESFISNANNYGLTKDEAFALWGYTTNYFYRDLNAWLRNSTNILKTNDLKSLINSGLAKLPKYFGDNVYRGIVIQPDELQGFLNTYKKGATHVWNDFSSCGGSQAASFGGRPEVNVIFEIRHTTGKEISDLADGIKYGTMPRPEILIKAGSKFEAISDPIFDTSLGKWKVILKQMQ